MSLVPPTFRRAMSLLLSLFLLSGTLAAKSPQQARTSKGRSSSSSAAPNSNLLNWFRNLRENKSCVLNPDGRCLPSNEPTQQPSNADNGCGIDPGGRCSG